MRCSQVTELLSEYVDDALDAPTKARLDEHLAHCPTCTAELASLRSYLGAMASLPRVQAPADFLAGVHERLEPPGVISKLANWLFFPLKLKLPFEVAGLVAASFLVVLLYRGTEPERASFTQAPPPPSAPAAPAPAPPVSSGPATGARMEATPTPPEARPQVQAQAPERGKGEGQPPRAVTADITKPKERTIPAAKPQLEAVPASQQPLELVLRLPSSTPQPLASALDFKQQAAAGGSTTPPLDRAQDPPLSRRMAPAPTRSAGDAEQPAAVDPATAFSRIKVLVEQAGGSVLSVAPEKDASFPQVVAVRLPAPNYSAFLNELRHLGRVEQPADQLPVPSQAALIHLQIRLVPPS